MPEEATPRGTPHQNDIVLEGATGGRDENLICTMQIPFSAASLADVLTVGGPVYHGLVESARSWTALNDDTGGYVVTVTYKGYLDEGEEPTEEDSEQWSMDFDYSEEPLQTHKIYQDLVKNYGGIPVAGDGDQFGHYFPAELPKGFNSRGLGGKKLGAGDKNPMYGVKSYAVMQARVSRSFSSKKIDNRWMTDVGKVVRSIPGAPQNLEDITPADRDWLVQPPKIQQNGDVFRVEQEWLLSPPGGWQPEVYDLIDG